MIRRILIIFSLLIPILWTLPTLTGYRYQSGQGAETQKYLGWMRSDDFHRYGSFIDQTRYKNRFIYKELSAVEPQSPRMIAVYFTILGLAGKLTGLSAQSLWMFSRIIVSWLFIWVLFLFIKRWKPKSDLTEISVFLVLFSSGIEVFATYSGIFFPRIKNYWMDGFSTFCSFHNPLKIAGITCVLILFLNMDSYLQKRKLKYLLLSVFMILLLWTIHPNSAIPGYTGILTLAFLLSSGKFNWKNYFNQWARMLPLLIPVILIGLFIKWMQTDKTTANIIQQYSLRFLTEPYRFYPLRYGIILPLGIMGFIWSFKKRTFLDSMLMGLLVGGEFFAHFAHMSGLLFQHMIHLPLALFAAVALSRFIKDRKNAGRVVFAVFIVLFSVQNIHILNKVMKQTRLDVWPTSLYWTQGEIKAAQILRDMDEGNVLVSRDSGNKLAWLSLHNVFLGHWGTTPEKGKKEKLLHGFYQMDVPLEEKKRIITDYQLKYIWYGPNEKKLGLVDTGLDSMIIYENEVVTIYRTGQPERLISVN